MGQVFEKIEQHIKDFIEAQHMYFVATAPDEGHVNVSPKGGVGTLAVIDAHTVAYLDWTGSGIETVAHVQQNRRVTLMWCAFEGPPNIVRVYGEGSVVLPGEDAWDALYAHFPTLIAARSIIVVKVERVSDSCGFGVPEYEYSGERSHADRWAQSKGNEGIEEYKRTRNAVSIDGLPGLAMD